MPKTVFKTTIVVISLLVSTNKPVKAGYYIQIFPQPKFIKYTSKPTGLPYTVMITHNGYKKPIIKYTTTLLSNNFKHLFGAKITTKPIGKYLTIVELSVDKNLTIPSEGYHIKFVGKEGNAHKITIKASSASGLLYGSICLLDILLESTRQAGRLSIPTGLVVKDEPTMRTRLLPTVVNRIDKSGLAKLDWLARWRINGIWLSTFESENLMKNLAKEANKRAITLYGMLSFRRLTSRYHHPLCPSEADDRKIIYDNFEKSARAGCGGLVFLFDDLGKEALNHHKVCPKCKNRFHSLAEIQVEFLKIMVNVAHKYKITKLIMCPTPYRAWWIDKYKLPHNYFEVISSAPELKEVKIFHTDFYYDVIKSLEKIGLKRYIWWNNGLWTTSKFYGIYVGIPKIGLSWGGFANDKTRGPIILTRSMLELYRLPKLTKDIYPAPTGDVGGEALGGIYSWYPQAYCVNEEGTRRFVIENLLGVYAYRPYKIWEQIMTTYATPSRKNISNQTLLKSLNLAKNLISEIKSLQKIKPSFYKPTANKIITLNTIKQMEQATQSALKKIKSQTNNLSEGRK